MKLIFFFLIFKDGVNVLETTDPNKYLNAGIWVTTIFFISVGLLMSFLSALMSLINTVTSPVEPMFNILGVFIWNSIAGKGFK